MNKKSIVLDDESNKILKELKEKLSKSSESEVIRASLKIAKYLKSNSEEGKEIIIRDEKTKKEKEIVLI